MSDDNVIRPAQFSGAVRRTDQIAGSRAARQRGEQMARLRAIEAGAFAGVSVGKRGFLLEKADDRKAAACAVGALVREARAQGITVARLREALPGSARLDRYMLPPDAEDRVLSGKSHKLLKRVMGYLQVAETIARLTHQDPDTLKIKVLVETSLWSRASGALTDVDPRADHLAVQLREMGRMVARRTGLRPLLERARCIPGQWDLLAERFAWAHGPMFGSASGQSPCLSHDAFAGWYEHWSEAPPLPSIPLVRCIHALFHTQARLEFEGRERPLKGTDACSSSFEGSVINVVLVVARAIRLALGPLAALETIGPMFESRAHISLLKLEPEPRVLDLLPNISLKPVDDLLRSVPAAVFQVLIDGRWHRLATLGDLDDAECQIFDQSPETHPLLWRAEPWDPRSPSNEHWYLSWSAITAESVAHWLHRPSGTNNTIVTIYEGQEPGVAIWYARDVIAHQIEHALANGGLEAALTTAVERLAHELDQWQAQWLSEASSRHQNLLARWQDDP